MSDHEHPGRAVLLPPADFDITSIGSLAEFEATIPQWRTLDEWFEAEVEKDE